MRLALFFVFVLTYFFPTVNRYDASVLAAATTSHRKTARSAHQEPLGLPRSATLSADQAVDTTKSLVMRKQALVPGTFIQNYQLVERTALLGTCLHRVSETDLDLDLELLSPPFSSTSSRSASLLKCPTYSSATSASASAFGTASFTGFTPQDPFATWMQRLDIDVPRFSTFSTSWTCSAKSRPEFYEHDLDQFDEDDYDDFDDDSYDAELASETLGLLTTATHTRHSAGFSAVEEGPMLEYQCMLMNQQDIIEPEQLLYVNENYRLRKKFEGGSFGEVWRATRIDHTTKGPVDFILKRVFVELGDPVLLSGLREVHFGQRLAGEPHVARFVESFFRATPVSSPSSTSAPAEATSSELQTNRRPQQPSSGADSKPEQENPPPPDTLAQELWLVFYDEGISLRNYLYSKVEAANSVIMERSPFWKRLRMDSHGEKVLKEIMRQLLEAVASLHARGITHRDIKPSNILVSNTNTRFSTNGRSDADSNAPVVKLADFGSAIDEHSLNDLYGDRGPTQAEETREYQPPEVIFHLAENIGSHGQRSQPHVQPPFDLKRPTSYDLWSLGVVFLEMVLGSPQVFLIDARAKVKLDATLARLKANKWRKARVHHHQTESASEPIGSESDDDPTTTPSTWSGIHSSSTNSDPSETDQQLKRKSYLLHVLTEFCIFQPEIDQFHSLLNRFALVANACHFGQFNTTVVKRDPLHKGLDDRWALDLIWRLLRWDPQQRISAKDALQHAFFKGPYVCEQSGRSFATLEELRMHQEYLGVQSRRQQQMAFMVREKYATPTAFVCPVCSRQFQTIQSCEQHIRARKHFAVARGAIEHAASGDATSTSSSTFTASAVEGNKSVKTHFCNYEAQALQQAVHQQTQVFVASTQANDPLAWQTTDTFNRSSIGVALFQGRRAYMEDFVLVQSNRQLDFTLFAVMDGHLGQEAARFVHQKLFQLVSYRLQEALRLHQHQSQRSHGGDPQQPSEQPEQDTSEQTSAQVLEDIAVRQAFLELNLRFLKTPEGSQLFSGCTLSLVVHFHQSNRLVSANVGDSKAFLYGWSSHSNVNQGTPSASQHSGPQPKDELAVVPLTRDHLPNAPKERARIESSGGFVEFAGLWRVVGQLAVSRSIGDRHLRQYITSEPSIFRVEELTNMQLINDQVMMILASDGLWEVFSPHEVAQFLSERMQLKYQQLQEPHRAVDQDDWNEIVEELIVEAYIRGSLDNIAVIAVKF